MNIPEMQVFKKKYPQYEGIEDGRLLDAVVKKYPQYQPILQRVADQKQKEEIDTATYVGGVEGIGRDIRTYSINAAKESVSNLKNLPIVGGYTPKQLKELGVLAQRPIAATQSLASGESPVEGFLEPEKAPSFLEGVEKAYPKSPWPVKALVASVLDIGVPSLIYGALPKAGMDTITKLKTLNKAKVLLEIPQFKNTNDALTYGSKIVGDENKIGALQELRDGVLKEVQKYKGMKDTPSLQKGLNLATKAQLYREAIEEARKTPITKGVVQELSDDQIYERASKLFNTHAKDIKSIRTNEQFMREGILIDTGDKWNKLGPGQQTIRWNRFEREMKGRLNLLPEVKRLRDAGIKVEYKPGQDHYEISVPHPTEGTQFYSGLPVDLGKLDAALTDIQGDLQVANVEFAKFAKKLGTPFFLGQKYPKFKSIYTAVQNGVDLNAELFFDAMQILKPQELRKVPVTSQLKILNALKTGNEPLIKRDFNPQELAERFKLDAGEIDIYNRFRKVYKLGLNMEMQKRKILMDYIAMSPEEQSLLNAKFDETIKRLGGGYMSQVRSEGVWGVYKPPAKFGGNPQFFTRVAKKSQAIKIADQLGEGATYSMMDTTSKEAYKHLTLSDLENLIAASGVREDAAAINRLRDELKKRTFLAHWIRRRDVPGYEWTWDNIVDSVIDYAAGASNSLSRVSGRTGAEAAYQLAAKGMDPALRIQSRNFIDGFYNTGTLGFGALNKVLYGWKLAFKVSWLVQNLSQPFSTTYPVLAQYYKGVVPEKVFLSSYKLAGQFLAHKWKGTPHGMSTELYSILQKAERQGVLGDQMTKFQLGAKQLSKQEFEKWLGLFGRAGEAINRSHSAVAGYRVATDVLKLQGEENIYAFVKEFVGKTQFLYGKQNIPTLITGAGNTKNLLRTAYTFRHYNISYIQLLNSMMPWRGGMPQEYLRALGGLGLQAGIMGLPFAATAMAIYKYYKENVEGKGGTAESDFRLAMKDYPPELIDAILRGGYTIAGVDASTLIGAGDVIPSYGTDLEKLGGAPVGFIRQLTQAAGYAIQGDYLRALENGSPDAIRNVFKAMRYAREGVRKGTGELITSPSAWDNTMQGLGFTPNKVTKAYAVKEAISSIQSTHITVQSKFNQRLAQARMDKDWVGYRRVLLEMREWNKKAGKGERVKPSRLGQRAWRRKFMGAQMNIPRAQRKSTRELVELYGVKEK